MTAEVQSGVSESAEGDTQRGDRGRDAGGGCQLLGGLLFGIPVIRREIQTEDRQTETVEHEQAAAGESERGNP